MLNRNLAFFTTLLTVSVCLFVSCVAGRAGGPAVQKAMSWEQLNKEMETKPNDAGLWLLRGQILSKSFEDSEAIEAYSRAIKLDPGLTLAYIGRGDAYMTYEKPNEALANYLKAQTLLKNAPGTANFVRVQVAIAQCYKAKKQYDLELPLRLSIAKYTHGPNDFASLAGCQMQNKQFKEAAESFRNAIKQNSGQVDLHRQFGEYYVVIGDYVNAAEEFTRALDVAIARHVLDLSGNTHLYELRAHCYDKLGRTALAIQDRRRAQKWQESIFDAAPVRDSRNE